MAGSRLAQHLPSLFGPSRRAAWRLSVVRRLLALAALLFAVQLAVGATAPPDEAAPSTPTTGATVALPLASAVDLPTGSTVTVYAAGRASPVARRATLVEAGDPGTTGSPRAQVSVPEEQVGPIVQELGATPRVSFVLVGHPGDR